eukprot:scaffold9468_cov130-Skeletonema_dohrnii-CCMP3373.AAC.10
MRSAVALQSMDMDQSNQKSEGGSSAFWDPSQSSDGFLRCVLWPSGVNVAVTFGRWQLHFHHLSPKQATA